MYNFTKDKYNHVIRHKTYNKACHYEENRILGTFGFLIRFQSKSKHNAQLHETENTDAARAADPNIFVNPNNFFSEKMSVASTSTAAAMDSWTTEEKLELASLAAKVRRSCCVCSL